MEIFEGDNKNWLGCKPAHPALGEPALAGEVELDDLQSPFQSYQSPIFKRWPLKTCNELE